ncbi:MAG: hypothetical protein IAG13_31425 [Deltaproteobacteria bacterium]|nr:hypothetical protein [Nannocystaceae bacterium]
MRLAKLRSGHRLGAKLKMTAMRVLSRRAVPDVVRTLMYRPEMFGTPLNELFEAALRGPSRWSVGERELFAAFVSNLNRCRF